MNQRHIRSIVVLAAITAIGGCAANPAPPGSVFASSPTAPSTGALPSIATPSSAADPDALGLAVLEAADVPEGIPVPVPTGGTVDDSLGVFEGQSFVVEFPASMFEAIAAYYDAWFASRGVAVPAEFPAEGTRVWRPEVDGTAVQLELYPLTGEAIRLFVTWP